MPAARPSLRSRIGLGILYLVMTVVLVACVSVGVNDVRGWTAPKYWGDFTTVEKNCPSRGSVCEPRGVWASDDDRITLHNAMMTTDSDLNKPIRAYYQPKGGDNQDPEEVHQTSTEIGSVIFVWVVAALLVWALANSLRHWLRERRQRTLSTPSR